MKSVFFFGESTAQIYGCLHSPNFDVKPRGGVLLCPPLGQEYLRCHRLMVRIAESFSSMGFYALRFDYPGTGDSYGDLRSVSIQQLEAAVHSAYSELESVLPEQRVYIFAARLGALLASSALASQVSYPVVRYLFWDPVLNGGEHIDRLLQMQSEALRDPCRFPLPRQQHTPRGNIELQGFTYGQGLMDQLRSLRIPQALFEPEKVDCLVTQEEMADYERLNGLSSCWAVHPLAVQVPWVSVRHLEEQILCPELDPGLESVMAGLS